MAFKIVRNDITKMNTEAIVNTANEQPCVDTGCDHAVYTAAGYDDLLNYRKDKIGSVPEGEVFITPGFKLAAKYIIHAVSPHFIDGESGEEEKLRSCYRKSLLLAKETGIRSIAFPLISTGGFGYPKEEGMRIAVDEINAFLSENDMDICLVVFDDSAKTIGEKLYPGLEEYIDRKYVERVQREEYDLGGASADSASDRRFKRDFASDGKRRRDFAGSGMGVFSQPMANAKPGAGSSSFSSLRKKSAPQAEESAFLDFETEHESKLAERMRHRSDSFSEYLLYLIQEKNLKNADVYKRAIVDKKIFSKIKNNPEYHPQKMTALCLCVGALLNLDEARDLLARAGYALSPWDKTDIIFSYFIENEIYDMIELDIQLEEHGLPCIIA